MNNKEKSILSIVLITTLLLIGLPVIGLSAGGLTLANTLSAIGILIILISALFVYFLPTLIAVNTRNKYHLQICILNTFLGFSLFGWVAALIWATMPLKSEQIQDYRTSLAVMYVFSIFTILSFLGYYSYVNSPEYKTNKNNPVYEQQTPAVFKSLNRIKEMKKP